MPTAAALKNGSMASVGNWTGKVEYLHMDFGSIATYPRCAGCNAPPCSQLAHQRGHFPGRHELQVRRPVATSGESLKQRDRSASSAVGSVAFTLIDECLKRSLDHLFGEGLDIGLLR